MTAETDAASEARPGERAWAWHAGSGVLERAQAAAPGGVVAAIVTYRPDRDRLAENLAAAMPQAAATVVYCNAAGETPWLPGLLEGRGCIWRPDTRNVGLARALNECCVLASALGASQVLLLDQDSVVGAGMVSILAGQLSAGVALVAPRVIDRNARDRTASKAQAGVVRVRRAITSGSLLSLAAWRQVGGFDERLFVDWVDFELSCSLRAQGYALLRDEQATILHEMGHRDYAFTLPGPHGGRPVYRTNHPKSRLRDKARSWAITLAKHRHERAGREELRYVVADAARDLVVERGHRGTLKAFAEGLAEGRRALRTEREAREDS